MRKTFLLSLALITGVSAVAESSESSPLRTATVGNSPRLLRSSALMPQMLPRFPEELMPRSHGRSLDRDTFILPAKVDGIVLQAGKGGVLEVSVGRDNGLKVGDKVDVYRGGQNLGRIELRSLEDNSAVGEMLPSSGRGVMIRRGDHVRIVRP